MKPYNERLPLIDTAIDALKGKWPDERFNELLLVDGIYRQWVSNRRSYDVVGTRDEFNQRKSQWKKLYEWGADKSKVTFSQFLSDKHLIEFCKACAEQDSFDWQDTLEKRPERWVIDENETLEVKINMKAPSAVYKEQPMKYEYGVEYETNGEKPDLPDDVKVEVKAVYRNSIDESDGSEWLSQRIVELNIWENTTKFRIVDERYKPKEQEMNSDLPPIGSIVDIIERGDLMYGHGETNCEVVGHFEDSAIVRMSYGLGCFSAPVLKLRTTEAEFDKVRADILDIIEANGNLSNGILADTLTEQGYRKIKPMSEGEFVQSALKSFQTKRFEVSQLKLVCESLRKLHMADLRFIDNGDDK